MTVGVGHRSLSAAPSEEDFATVLKEADGAFLANQNFHDVETRMTLAPDLPNPTDRRPAQSPLFPPIHRPIPFPADFRHPCLNFDEDEHLAFEHDEVELVAPVPPVGRETATTLPAIMRLGLALAPGAQIRRQRSTAPPCLYRPPEFTEKHNREDHKSGVFTIPRTRGS